MSAKKVVNRDHQFLEVDEDLRRIGERDAAKPVCPFGQKCYRKNPTHRNEYRHPPVAAHSSKTTKIKEKKNWFTSGHSNKKRITDFFRSQDPPPKKAKIETKVETEKKAVIDERFAIPLSDSEYVIDDDSEDEIPKKTVSKNTKESDKRTKLLPKEDKLSDHKTLLIDPKATPNQMNEVFKELFLTEMPNDFYQFWRFCKNLKPAKPEDALVKALGLRLVGPYDILSGKVTKESVGDKQKILRHWRYYYDLPEMQTIVASVKSGHHLAYFRDSPDESNPVIVSNNGDNCLIDGIADNIFGAIHHEIQRAKSKMSANTDLKTIESKLKEFCNQNKINFTDKTKLKDRKTKVNAKTFNGFGLVVPYNKKTEVGYRPLPMNDSALKVLLKNIIKADPEIREDCKSLSDLKEIYQLISYANDECDFGMGLELGIDLFCSGDPFFHKSVEHWMSLAYELLKREAFATIIRAHMADRRKGYHLESI